MNNDLVRLEKIKNERVELLKRVRETLRDSGDKYSDSLSYITSLIETDEISINKYEALIKSQELISNLIIEVSNSNSQEDIAQLRSKINYLIGKVKKELASRSINSDDMEVYKERTKSLRKDISKYVRYLKRESNVVEIEDLLNKYSDLSEEEIKKLKKLLNNERNYNNRQFRQDEIDKKKDNIKLSNSDNTADSLENNETVNKNEMKLNVIDSKNEEKEQIDLNQVFQSLIDSKKEEKKNIKITDLFGKSKSNSKSDMKSTLEMIRKNLLVNANSYKAQYKLKDIHEYDSKSLFVVNIFKLLRNIPIYAFNNLRVKYMISDRNLYYRGSDLISYIAYTKKRNSILTGLKSIFSKSYLYNGEGRYLNQHEECSKWLYDYCERNNLSVKGLSRSV